MLPVTQTPPSCVTVSIGADEVAGDLQNDIDQIEACASNALRFGGYTEFQSLVENLFARGKETGNPQEKKKHLEHAQGVAQSIAGKLRQKRNEPNSAMVADMLQLLKQFDKELDTPISRLFTLAQRFRDKIPASLADAFKQGDAVVLGQWAGQIRNGWFEGQSATMVFTVFQAVEEATPWALRDDPSSATTPYEKELSGLFDAVNAWVSRTAAELGARYAWVCANRTIGELRISLNRHLDLSRHPDDLLHVGHRVRAMIEAQYLVSHCKDWGICERASEVLRFLQVWEEDGELSFAQFEEALEKDPELERANVLEAGRKLMLAVVDGDAGACKNIARETYEALLQSTIGYLGIDLMVRMLRGLARNNPDAKPFVAVALDALRQLKRQDAPEGVLSSSFFGATQEPKFLQDDWCKMSSGDLTKRLFSKDKFDKTYLEREGTIELAIVKDWLLKIAMSVQDLREQKCKEDFPGPTPPRGQLPPTRAELHERILFAEAAPILGDLFALWRNMELEAAGKREEDEPSPPLEHGPKAVREWLQKLQEAGTIPKSSRVLWAFPAYLLLREARLSSRHEDSSKFSWIQLAGCCHLLDELRQMDFDAVLHAAAECLEKGDLDALRWTLEGNWTQFTPKQAARFRELAEKYRTRNEAGCSFILRLLVLFEVQAVPLQAGTIDFYQFSKFRDELLHAIMGHGDDVPDWKHMQMMGVEDLQHIKELSDLWGTMTKRQEGESLARAVQRTADQLIRGLPVRRKHAHAKPVVPALQSSYAQTLRSTEATYEDVRQLKNRLLKFAIAKESEQESLLFDFDMVERMEVGRRRDIADYCRKLVIEFKLNRKGETAQMLHKFAKKAEPKNT